MTRRSGWRSCRLGQRRGDDTPLARTKKEMLEKFRPAGGGPADRRRPGRAAPVGRRAETPLAVLAMARTDDLKGLGKVRSCGSAEALPARRHLARQIASGTSLLRPAEIGPFPAPFNHPSRPWRGPPAGVLLVVRLGSSSSGRVADRRAATCWRTFRACSFFVRASGVSSPRRWPRRAASPTAARVIEASDAVPLDQGGTVAAALRRNSVRGRASR